VRVLFAATGGPCRFKWYSQLRRSSLVQAPPVAIESEEFTDTFEFQEPRGVDAREYLERGPTFELKVRFAVQDDDVRCESATCRETMRCR
jgi:hypothetical protein